MRIVVRLTTTAKVAAAVAMAGGALAVYGRMRGVPWAGGIGTAMLFAGALVYYVERFRMLRARSRNDPPPGDRPPG